MFGDMIYINNTFIIDPRGVEFGWGRNLNSICWKTCFIYAKTSGTGHESGLEMRKPCVFTGMNCPKSGTALGNDMFKVFEYLSMDMFHHSNESLRDYTHSFGMF